MASPGDSASVALRAALDSRSPPLLPHQQAFCSNHTLQRYLAARKGDSQKALMMLLATIEWRDAFGVDLLTGEGVRPNGETGKVFVCGPDLAGKPVLLLRPGRENSKDDHDGNLKHLVYQLERAVKCMDEDGGVGKMTVILDLNNYSSANAPPMRTSRATLDILQNHYPERLSRFIILNAPWLFFAFFKVISPFIDKVTASKIAFLTNAKTRAEELAAMVPLDRIPASLLQPSLHSSANDRAFFNPDHYFSQKGESEQQGAIEKLRSELLASQPAVCLSEDQ